MRVLDAYPVVAEAFSVIREETGGQYVVCDCPLRGHSTSRLRFWLGKDGRLMFGCFACGPARKLEILRAAGLSWRNCFPEGTEIGRQHQECTAKYKYRDESGRLLYMTLRLEPGHGGRDKEFSQCRPNPDYDPKRAKSADNRPWLRSLGDVRRVLYRLPELLRADPARPVFVVAGEKDVETLRALNLVATTNVCGESAEWLPSYTESLARRHIVVVEDADATGHRHANEVCGALLPAVRTLSRVRLPQKDATAFVIACQRAAQDLFSAPDPKRAFIQECLRAPVWASAAPADRCSLV